MAQKKISELTSTTKLNDDNIIPLVQDGVTKHIRYGDMKAPMVREVEANVEGYVDNKINTRTRYAFTTMVDLGFTKNSHVKVRTLWEKLYSKYGEQGLIQFDWNSAKGAYIGTSDDCFNSGGTLIYSCDGGIGAWKLFSAIYYTGYSNEVFHIRCSISSDTSDGSESWAVTKLADNADILSIRSNLLDVNGKLDYMYNHYPSQEKVIGKWHDGRNIMRLVVKSDSDTFTIGQVSYQSTSVTALGLNESLPKDKVAYVISAKLYSKNETNAIELSVNDLISSGTTKLAFTRNNGSLNTLKSTYDCVVIEYVQK